MSCAAVALGLTFSQYLFGGASGARIHFSGYFRVSRDSESLEVLVGKRLQHGRHGITTLHSSVIWKFEHKALN